MAFATSATIDLNGTRRHVHNSHLCPLSVPRRQPSAPAVPPFPFRVLSSAEPEDDKPSVETITSPAPKPITTKEEEVSTLKFKPKRLSNAQVVLERLGDTVIDAQIHYGRLFSLGPKSRRSSTKKKVERPRVVVLGTGWGAHSLVKIIDVSALQSVTVISPRNFFFFTPLLSATAVGTIEFRSIVEPIRKANPFVDYFEAAAVDVDVKKRTVLCVRNNGSTDQTSTNGNGNENENGDANNQLSFEVPYDVLVVAVGETTATFNVPGARQYAYFLKEITDARKLRSNLLDCLERASLPIWTREQRRDLLQFIVVGGGPTGCEFSGELSDFVSKDLAPKYGEELVSDIQVTLLQSGKTLLNQFETSLQQQALQSFQGRVNVRLGARVSKVTKDYVLLQNGEQLPYGLLVWAAGNATRDIVTNIMKKLDLPDTMKKLPVDPWFRVPQSNGIYALGDCTQMISNPLPATAQVAGQQGAYLGRLLSKAKAKSLQEDSDNVPVLRDSGGREIHPFQFLSLGIMAYLGNDRAIVQVEATKDTNLTISGRVAYALWRSVYAVKQVDVRNRVLVLFDYFKSRVYGRDISQF